MIRVKLTANLIETFLRSGHKTGYLLEIIQGIPLNAQLVDAKMEDGLVALYFSQPTVPDTELTDLNIAVKGIRATPIEIENVPAPKPKYDSPGIVEKVIG